MLPIKVSQDRLLTNRIELDLELALHKGAECNITYPISEAM